MKNLYIKITTNEVKYYSLEKRAVIFAILFKKLKFLFLFFIYIRKRSILFILNIFFQFYSSIGILLM